MAQKAHRVFIDSIARDSSDHQQLEEASRYTFSVGGEGFSTDGKHVNLPYDVKESIAMEVQAAIAHEVYGHGTFSDWAVVQGIGQRLPGLFGLLNTFEDMTVDKRVAERYPQFMEPGEHYSKLLVYALKKISKNGGVEKVRKNLDQQAPNMEIRITLELLWMAYKRLGVTKGLGDHHPLSCDKVLAFVKKHEALIEIMINAATSPTATTKKNVGLATKMWKLIHGTMPEEEKQQLKDDWKLEDFEVPDGDGQGGCPPPPPCKCGCHGGKH